MSLTVKVYFESEETRRFRLDEGVCTSYDFLKQKVELLFPDLMNTPFKTRWKDEEDFITISSDDELLDAIGNRKDDVLKLYVHRSSCTSSSNSGAAHPGIVCDGCSCTVSGNRFKCIRCRDYDLCGTCFARNLHPEHEMLVIRNHGSMPRFLIPLLDKIMYRFQEWEKKSDDAETESVSSADSRGRGGGRKWRHGCAFRGGFGPWKRGWGPWAEHNGPPPFGPPEHFMPQFIQGQNIPWGQGVQWPSWGPGNYWNRSGSGTSGKRATSDGDPTSLQSTSSRSSLMAGPEVIVLDGSTESQEGAVAEDMCVSPTPLTIDLEHDGSSQSNTTTVSGKKQSSQDPSTPDTITTLPSSCTLSEKLTGEYTDALERLKSMGFSDDEGRLTRLIIAKKGDLNQVLNEIVVLNNQ